MKSDIYTMERWVSIQLTTFFLSFFTVLSSICYTFHGETADFHHLHSPMLAHCGSPARHQHDYNWGLCAARSLVVSYRRSAVVGH